MKILFAGDEHAYSEYAVRETVNLAMNTWADVMLLGVHTDHSARNLTSPADLKVARVFGAYRDLFQGDRQGGESPYGVSGGGHEWKSLKSGRWEDVHGLSGGTKDFRVRLRAGKPASEILAEARENQSDLIVLGCTKGEHCDWEDSKDVPRQIVNDADCSVLLVKEEQPVDKIRACFDQGYVSQESLELVNQMVTIHSAELDLIGLSENGSIKVDAFSKLSGLGQYYADRDMNVSTRVTEMSKFESMISGDQERSLLAIWAGKKSLIGKFFPRDWIGRFVSKCGASVLVMR